ncbi:hypothetical protein MSG28_014311 [Choristoneura fumiferana]|uniref:Uncharacterized protein n=1 Tax=Choristoneura fumiferana TaxID=7141 RepID=A0ACC0JGT6_CHOFU|nr:hypothetical protein MSG28_014311 [Choristoneura fumiferana]
MQKVIIDVLLIFFIVFTLSTRCFAYLEDPIDYGINYEDPTEQSYIPIKLMPHELTEAMDLFQFTADRARKQVRDGILTQEETLNVQVFMSQVLDDILDFVQDPNNAYNFLNAQGFDKIVTRNLGVPFDVLRGRLLVLIKTLFDVAPTTTKTVIPLGILDKLVDIFEQDDSLMIKFQAMEIMSIWLPNNVQAQERVMKQRGLEPFYKQISKLDVPSITMILKLFNNIITEHMTARNKKIQKSKVDYTTLKRYQRIALIERMSTPAVCNGLLNILADIWPFATEGNDTLPLVVDLIQNIKPHCYKVFKGRSKAIALISQILSYLRDPTQHAYFESLNLNVTEVNNSLTDFVENIKAIPRFEL